MYYKIDFFGKDVTYTQKGNTWILNISNTPKNTLYVLVRLDDRYDLQIWIYYTFRNNDPRNFVRKGEYNLRIFEVC